MSGHKKLFLPIHFGEVEWGLGLALAAQIDLAGHRFSAMIHLPPFAVSDPDRHRRCLQIAIHKATREIVCLVNAQVALGAISLHMPQEAA